MNGIGVVGAGVQWYAYTAAPAYGKTPEESPAQAASVAADPVTRTAFALTPSGEALLPDSDALNNAGDALVRLRIRSADQDDDLPGDRLIRRTDLQNELAMKQGALDDAEEAALDGTEERKSPAEVMEAGECETCERRKYQDGSDDPGVSFQSPTRISPEQAASTVRGHEQEHVVRERAEAEREGRKVVSQRVEIHTDVCPECGRVYVSGGTTYTTTAKDASGEDAENAIRGVRKVDRFWEREQSESRFEASI